MSVEDKNNNPLIVTPLVDKLPSSATTQTAVAAADQALKALEGLLENDTTGEGVEITFRPNKTLIILAPNPKRRIGRPPFQNTPPKNLL